MQVVEEARGLVFNILRWRTRHGIVFVAAGRGITTVTPQPPIRYYVRNDISHSLQYGTFIVLCINALLSANRSHLPFFSSLNVTTSITISHWHRHWHRPSHWCDQTFTLSLYMHRLYTAPNGPIYYVGLCISAFYHFLPTERQQDGQLE